MLSSTLHFREKEESKARSTSNSRVASISGCLEFVSPVLKHYNRNPSGGPIDKEWQGDLADLSWLTRINGGYRYLLSGVDCFSKYSWAIPFKTKRGQSLLEAFRLL